MRTFVRFAILDKDEGTRHRLGIFQAVSDLEYAGVLLDHERQQYDEIYEWFRHHLKKPRSLSRSSRPGAKKVALSWYKDCALEHIAKTQGLVEILRAHGIAVEMLRTTRPGYIVYEDAYQVAAEPFRETLA